MVSMGVHGSAGGKEVMAVGHKGKGGELAFPP